MASPNSTTPTSTNASSVPPTTVPTGRWNVTDIFNTTTTSITTTLKTTETTDYYSGDADSDNDFNFMTSSTKSTSQCNQDQNINLGCLNGVCQIREVAVGNEVHPQPYCQCDDGFEGIRCNFFLNLPVKGENDDDTGMYVGIGVAVGLVLVLLIIIGVCLYCRRRKGKHYDITTHVPSSYENGGLRPEMESMSIREPHNMAAVREEHELTALEQPATFSSAPVPTSLINDMSQFNFSGDNGLQRQRLDAVAETGSEMGSGPRNGTTKEHAVTKLDIPPTFTSAPVPTPLANDMSHFSFSRDNGSPRNRIDAVAD